MQKLIIGISLSLLLVISCCKDKPMPNSINIFKDKLRTVEVFQIQSENVPVVFYFYYDSISGMLDSVMQNIRFNSKDTMTIYARIRKMTDGNLVVNNQLKIYTIDKGITSITLNDTINNTENITTRATFINNQIDSFYDKGLSLLHNNNNFFNFQFTNGNCVKCSNTWKEMYGFPPAIDKSAEIEINYSNIINNMPIYMQDVTELNSLNSYGLLLYFLRLDGYYMIQPNKNLIDSYKINGEFDTTFVQYKYLYTGNNITTVNNIMYSSIDTLNKVTYSQHMTYY